MSSAMPGESPGSGLSAAEAALRLEQQGFNELPRPDRRDVLHIVLGVLREPMFALLIVGGVIYLLLGDKVEALMLLCFATLSVLITVIQEARSERVLDSLASLASPRALVVRDGVRRHIAAREVVQGDRMVIAEGDRVAADATLLDADDLLVDESLLTGESVPVRKRIAGSGSDAARELHPGGDDQPGIYAGTLVVRGGGQAVVTATGVRTEMGAIGRALGSIETGQPHLQRQLQWLVRDFAIVGAVAGTLAVLLFGLLRGTWLQAMLSGIALGMSLLPEEFPLVLAVFMAMGAWRISKARVLTRRASAIESLGATTVLCTDKTGTLTENRMSVVAVQGAHPGAASDPPFEVALRASADAPVDPMDLAIHDHHARRLAAAGTPAGSQAMDGGAGVLRSYGLRSDLLAVTMVRRAAAGAGVACAKGAFEAIAELCRLGVDDSARLRRDVERMAGEGMRVLGLAQAVLTAGQLAALPASPREFAFEFAGLIGFADPLRASVPAAVQECRSAGIRVVMITGDFPATALAIAGAAGIDAGSVLAGNEIDVLSDAQLALRVRDTSVFARIRPVQKLRLVESFKANGEIVAMTGDGVNDAPAIKSAHIGIAMGGRGTDVAREAAAIVLLDDDFGSIVATIRLGRRIYDNLRKAIEYIVAVHIPIVGMALLPLLLGLPLLLAPIHIAFLEMLIDPACSVVFEAEGEEEGLMKRPPRDPASPLLLPRRVWWAVIQGLLVLAGLGTVVVGAAHLGVPDADLRALAFTALVLTNLGLILVNRSFSSSLGSALLRPNRSLASLVLGIAALLAIGLFWPPARALFHFGRLHWDDLALCVLTGAASVVVLEGLKTRWFRPQLRGGKAA